jgi:hypothetical protein
MSNDLLNLDDLFAEYDEDITDETVEEPAPEPVAESDTSAETDEAEQEAEEKPAPEQSKIVGAPRQKAKPEPDETPILISAEGIGDALQNVDLTGSLFVAEFSVSTWGNNKKDNNASAEVTASKHAKAGMARVNKTLLQSDTLKAIKSLHGNARNNPHYEMTSAYGNVGWRVFTAQTYPDYVHLMGTGISSDPDNVRLGALGMQFAKLVDEFVEEYAEKVQAMQLDLGDLFNAADYPPADRIKEKFAWRVNIMPLAAPSQFHQDMASDIYESVASNYQRHFEEQVASAMQEKWGKMYERLNHLIAAVTDDPAKDGKANRFKESTVDNLKGMLNVLDSFNLTDDPALQDASDKLRDALDGVDAPALRASESLRRETRRKLEAAKAALPSLS